MKQKNKYGIIILAILSISFSILLSSCTKTNTVYVPTTIHDTIVTIPPPPIDHNLDPLIDANGNSYKVIKINTQYWTVEDFKGTKYNDGTSINIVEDSAQWLVTGFPAMCHYDKDQSKTALYNGFAVNTGKLAPKGWHVPTINDYNKLLSNAPVGEEAIWIKSPTTEWIGDKDINNPNRNKLGFSLLPTGDRGPKAAFVNRGNWGLFWLSTIYPVDNQYLEYALQGSVGSLYFAKQELMRAAMPVRFVKDN